MHVKWDTVVIERKKKPTSTTEAASTNQQSTPALIAAKDQLVYVAYEYNVHLYPFLASLTARTDTRGNDLSTCTQPCVIITYKPFPIYAGALRVVFFL